MNSGPYARLVAALVLVLSVGCHRKSPPPPEPTPTQLQPALPPANTIIGVYRSSFEASWLAPCGASPADSLWWVTLTDRSLRQRDSIAGPPKAGVVGPFLLIGRGTSSGLMRAGHMGRGTRYVLIEDITELRPVAEPRLACAGVPTRPPE